MKQNTRNKLVALTAGLTLIGSIYAGKTIVNQHKKIGQLEQELSHREQKVLTTQLDRDNCRKQLIYHGNPEGWQATGDDLTGETYFTRLNGDSLGNCWTEYLH